MLACEEARDEGSFAVRIPVPFSLRDEIDGHALPAEFFVCGEWTQWMSFPVHIEVLVQAIDEEVEEFFGVLLAVDAPLFVEAGTEVAQGGGTNSLYVVAPHRPDQVGIDFGHNAIRAFPVFLDKVPPSVVEEELGKWKGRKETLNGGVHIAGDAKVNETGSG